jgi:cellulose biosynthesis protein BcsQ
MPCTFVTLANQKGGVGKSTLTVLLASALHEMGLRVAIVDCDYQRSIYNHRQRDLSAPPAPDAASTTPYPVLQSAPGDVFQVVEPLVDTMDYVFMDMPGTFQDKGILSILGLADYILIPFSASHYDLDSTIESIEQISRLAEKLAETGKQTRIALVANKFAKTNTNADMIDFVGSLARIRQLTLFQTRIRQLEDYKRALSTLRALPAKTEADEAVRLVAEFLAFTGRPLAKQKEVAHG